MAFQLLDIFLLFVAPAILQIDNGSEFTVIRELHELWPQLNMVHGKPRHPHPAWITDNNTQDWSMVLRFMQNMNNSVYHSGINRTPYAAKFGTDPKLGLTSSSLRSEKLERLETEDDLLSVLSTPT